MYKAIPLSQIPNYKSGNHGNRSFIPSQYDVGVTEHDEEMNGEVIYDEGQEERGNIFCPRDLSRRYDGPNVSIMWPTLNASVRFG
jgi:hypothetical protein